MNAELIRWAALVQMYEEPLRKGSADCPATDVFADTEQGNKRWEQLKKRCVEHVSILGCVCVGGGGLTVCRAAPMQLLLPSSVC